jgi:hypothetical protein
VERREPVEAGAFARGAGGGRRAGVLDDSRAAAGGMGRTVMSTTAVACTNHAILPAPSPPCWASGSSEQRGSLVPTRNSRAVRAVPPPRMWKGQLHLLASSHHQQQWWKPGAKLNRQDPRRRVGPYSSTYRWGRWCSHPGLPGTGASHSLHDYYPPKLHAYPLATWCQLAGVAHGVRF